MRKKRERKGVKTRYRTKSRREGKKDEGMTSVGIFYIARGHYPNTLPISPRTSECRSDRRPNPRVILPNPEGRTVGIRANRQSIPNVSTNPSPASGVAAVRV